MAESRAEIILRTTKEGSGAGDTSKELANVKDQLTNVEKAIAGSRTTIGGLDKEVTAFGSSVGSTADMLNGMGVSIPIDPMMLFGQAIQAGAQFARESIADYAAYVDQISKMASFTSTSTEEMSKLYQITDDLRIPVGDLEMALKTMTSKGTAPSIAGIQELSEKYLAIADPLARAQFLTDNFGRAGQEMGRLMEMGAIGIDEAADSIENWMIVTGKSEEQIKAYLATQDRWGEALDEVKYQFAMGVTPAVNLFMDAILNTNDEINDSLPTWAKWIPQIRSVAEGFTLVKNILQGFDLPDDEVEEYVDAVKEISGAWQGASSAASAYANTTRGSIYDRPNYGSIYAGGRAEGGDVLPNQSIRVGEREVEYLTLPMGGSVTPISQGSNISVVIDYHPLISLGDKAEAERVLAPMVKQALRDL